MASKKNIKYKCPFCDKRFIREDLVIHVQDEHDDLIPENFTPLRYIFNYVNKRPLSYHGKCTECGGPTKWDENKGRYNRQCEKESCKKSFVKNFENNMIRTMGVTRISSTAEGQEKMLANRKISGTYKFQNGTEKTYTGSYELKALEFFDKVLNCDPNDILSPGPVLEYEYNGTKHLYISDFYYQPYNLIIEVKDGGDRPNKRNMPEYRGKQIAKEKYIVQNTNYNYLRLTDNDFSQLLSVFSDLKMQLVENTGERVIHINETMDALNSGYLPGMYDKGSVFIVNYMMNNAFSGEPERGFAVADNIKLDNLICRDDSGLLVKKTKEFLENATYNVYITERNVLELPLLFGPYINQFVEEGFIYERIFDKKLYSYDQIEVEESAHEVIDYYKGMQLFQEMVTNYINPKFNDSDFILTNENSCMTADIDNTNSDKCTVCYFSIKEGIYKLQSIDYPELVLYSESFMDDKSIESKFLNSFVSNLPHGGKINE